jgi:hypothetical protein
LNRRHSILHIEIASVAGSFLISFTSVVLVVVVSVVAIAIAATPGYEKMKIQALVLTNQ